MPSRDRSWITRSSPSYAKRPLMRTASSRDSSRFSSCCLAMPALLRRKEHAGGEELARAERPDHRPWRKRARPLGDGNAEQSGEQVIARGNEDAGRHDPPASEESEGEQDRPQPRQQPHAAARVGGQREREQSAGDEGGRQAFDGREAQFALKDRAGAQLARRNLDP